jgi:phosphotransferase family enzyme
LSAKEEFQDMLDESSLRAFLAGLGYSGGAPIGSGMEGVVYRLGDGLVAKAWFHRRAAELAPLGDFYRELADQGLPFGTPELVGTHDFDGRAVTVERELCGTVLGDGGLSPEAAQDAMLGVAAALRRTRAGAATRALTVLDETKPARTEGDRWAAALASLTSRRAEAFRAGRIPDFEAVLERLLLRLDQLPAQPDAIVHGDLCPANVLVDGSGRVTAVLDWGFLTTAGDNAFDASVAAGIFDMYGPDARTVDDRLMRRLETEFGYARDVLLLYRAAYAVITAYAHSPDGSDGHFQWCAAALNRPDVRDALFSAD